MTPLETLQKYGLKTDIGSIKERIETKSHYSIVFVKTFGIGPCIEEASALRSADLALLCSLAEKGERYEKAVKFIEQRQEKNHKLSLTDDPNDENDYKRYMHTHQLNEDGAILNALKNGITEAEGGIE